MLPVSSISRAVVVTALFATACKGDHADPSRVAEDPAAAGPPADRAAPPDNAASPAPPASETADRPAPTAAGQPAHEAAAPPFELTELGPDALVVTTQPFAANTLLVRTAGGAIILVDTPTTPADTAAVLDWIRGRWGAEPSYAIASHWHADASGGNQVLVERGVEVISSKATARLVTERGAAGRDELIAMFAERDPETARELEAMIPTPAARTVEVKGRAVLELGGETVELHHPAPSHSPDSIGIYFPERKLLYGGCTVRSDGRSSTSQKPTPAAGPAPSRPSPPSSPRPSSPVTANASTRPCSPSRSRPRRP